MVIFSLATRIDSHKNYLKNNVENQEKYVL